MDWYQYSGTVLAAAIVLGLIGYALYHLLTPSDIQASVAAESTFNAYQTVMKLAPLGCPTTPSYRLCDYYMASSAYSLFPGSKIYDYITDSVIPPLMKSGPRLVELDIYTDVSDNPVVGLKNQTLGTDYAYNTVSFEACCVALANNAFNSVSCPVSSDPFVLSLVFHTDKTNVIDACAQILKDTCHTYLLDSSYSYQRKNLAIEPVCNLQSKLIVVSGPETKGTLMDEVVNMSWGTSTLRRLTYKQASQTQDSDELINNNRNNITMVVPDIGSDLVNVNPQILLTYGCQWNLMNYGSVDSAMEVYIGEFQENSLVLKPEALRALAVKKYAQPVLPDPAVSFQPMQKTSPIYTITV
uniref:phosphoinositide phospholipase C n=1 Tax=viral metagenome TaxID=1070528 RepID=A0A6C0AIW2_9ZZZZ